MAELEWLREKLVAPGLLPADRPELLGLEQRLADVAGLLGVGAGAPGSPGSPLGAVPNGIMGRTNGGPAATNGHILPGANGQPLPGAGSRLPHGVTGRQLPQTATAPADGAAPNAGTGPAVNRLLNGRQAPNPTGAPPVSGRHGLLAPGVPGGVATIVLSDDAGSSERIEQFSGSQDRWMVAVRASGPASSPLRPSRESRSRR